MRNIIFLLLLISFCGCESDDICSDKVITPRIIIRLYDKDARNKTKSVNNLMVLGKGHSQNKSIQFSTSDSIVAPLKILDKETSLVLIKNAVIKDNKLESGDPTELKIMYETKHIFSDKGCGYKVVYENISTEIPSSSWISSVKVIQNHLDDEKRAVIHIFH